MIKLKGFLDQAQQSLDIATYVYQQGAGTLLDVLDAERTYRETQLAYRQALAAYIRATEPDEPGLQASP